MSNGLVSRGVRAGFWAAISLAVWFSVADVVRAQPLRTPAYMSGLIFSFTTALPATARLVAFTAILLITYAAVGVVTSVLLAKLKLTPHWYLGVVLGAVLFGMGYLLGRVVFDVNLPRALGWFASAAGDLITGLVIIGYLRPKRATL